MQVKYSFGATVFINTDYTKFYISGCSRNELVLWLPLQQEVLQEKGQNLLCPTLAAAFLIILSFWHVFPAELSKGYDFGNPPENYLNNSQTGMLEFKLIFSL